MLSAALLLAASAVGAGILALPVLTGLAGAVPALSLMMLSWALMAGTGLILLDQMHRLAEPADDLGGLYRARLGRWGAVLAGAVYLLLFNGLLVAYLSGAAAVLGHLLGAPQARPWLVLGFFGLGAGLILFGLRVLERANALMMALLVISFAVLVAACWRDFQPTRLAAADWYFLPHTAPIVLCAFGYHNLVPLIWRGLERDTSGTARAILIGTGITLLLNLVWAVTVIGALPLTGPGPGSLLAAFRSNLPATVPLAAALGSKVIGLAGAAFSLLAIITSYVAVGAALISFLSEALGGAGLSPNRWAAAAGALLPSLAVSWLYPGLFLKALNLVGGGCLIVLFGIMPCLMALGDRRPSRRGLRWAAAAMLALFAALLLLEIMQEAGWLRIPPLVNHWLIPGAAPR